MKNHDVSEPLRKRILRYCLLLWEGQNGYQIPVFLTEAPGLLREEIMVAAYGKHLYQVSMAILTDSFCILRFIRITCLNVVTPIS